MILKLSDKYEVDKYEVGYFLYDHIALCVYIYKKDRVLGNYDKVCFDTKSEYRAVVKYIEDNFEKKEEDK